MCTRSSGLVLVVIWKSRKYNAIGTSHEYSYSLYKSLVLKLVRSPKEVLYLESFGTRSTIVCHTCGGYNISNNVSYRVYALLEMNLQVYLMSHSGRWS